MSNENEFKKGGELGMNQEYKVIQFGEVKFTLKYTSCLPPLESEEFEKLKADIMQHGILIPIVVDEDFCVIDGAHRLEIAQQLQMQQIPFQIRPRLSEDEKWNMAENLNFHRRHLSQEKIRKIIEENRNKLPRLALTLRQDGHSYRQIGDQLKISHKHARHIINQQATGTEVPLDLPQTIKGKDGKVRPAIRPVIHANSGKEVQRVANACQKIGSDSLPGKTIELKRLERIARESENDRLRQQEVHEFHDGRVQLLPGDFAIKGGEIKDNTVDLIFSDPPYDQISLPLWDHLGILAKRVLKLGGLLLSYSGNLYLPQILDILREHMNYLWEGAIYHSGAKKMIPAVRVLQAWKPVLMFYKPPLNKWWRPTLDMVSGGESKENHDWEQSVAEAAHYIKTYCPKEGTLLDPMMGSGTSIIAGLESGLGFRCIGIEIDKAAFSTAQTRIERTLEEIKHRKETA